MTAAPSDGIVEPGPLAGIKILDLSQGIAGPYAAAILAMQGAQVIKVEPPEGDWSRLMGGGKQGLTALSIACNPSKQSVCVDARKPEGAELLASLVEGADVMIESFRPGVIGRLGLDYATLAKRHPRLLYVSLTGFGDSGPYRDLPCADSVVQALTGMMVMNRDAADQPRRIGMMAVDMTAGLYAAQGMTAGLLRQARTGKGGFLPVTLMQSAAALQGIPILDAAMHAGAARKPPVTVPSGTFRTRDGLVNLTALRDKMFHGLARALGQPAWIDDPRYRSNADRLAHADEINARIQALLLDDGSGNWVARFRAEDVLCAPVLDYAGFMADPQARAQGVFADIEQGPYGKLPYARLPGPPCATVPSAPVLGEHTEQILVDAGILPARVAELRAAGVVYTHDDIAARQARG
ncbi:CaiB/BaiF CoA-transferase family protein [Bordetella sp. LUAb4]|uniref:CaiB/BaiF CoA transferase family protein n=1 Tax=Bordetella sp. LUAb4 TaxID=2843195 RepID=UPI001E3F80A5|nr:CoA transferase [Bordetella sp. LUAb4]